MSEKKRDEKTRRRQEKLFVYHQVIHIILGTENLGGNYHRGIVSEGRKEVRASVSKYEG